MYFFEHEFAVEIDEKGHTDRNQNEENERQTKIKKHSDCNFFTGLILMQRVLIFFFKLVKCWVALLNQIKKLEREQKAEIKEVKGKLKKTRSSNKIIKKQK